uniref:Uncharacterized protein MANES_04G019700 n=1 Tax=Rhizophora mucronata TaxID=61149 RepID=A0A2P2LJU5_RHIMU
MKEKQQISKCVSVLSNLFYRTGGPSFGNLFTMANIVFDKGSITQYQKHQDHGEL